MSLDAGSQSSLTIDTAQGHAKHFLSLVLAAVLYHMLVGQVP